MPTKIQAAKMATASGVAVIIADGREPEVLSRLAAGENVGTLFLPTASKVESRKRWMVSGLSRRGALAVDDGAAAALRSGNRSLLPAGVRMVEGPFQRGDIVSIKDGAGHEIACGLVNYGAQELQQLKGLRSYGDRRRLGVFLWGRGSTQEQPGAPLARPVPFLFFPALCSVPVPFR